MAMLWVIFVVLAAFIWAAANIIDKFVMTKWVKNPFLPMLVSGFLFIAVVPLIYFFQGFSFLSKTNILLALAAGIFYGAASFAYFKVLKTEEVSRAVPLFYLDTIFILFFASVFLSEFFSLEKYAGIFLLVIGAIIISSKGIAKLHFEKSLGLIILAAIFYSIHSVILKYLFDFADMSGQCFFIQEQGFFWF